MLTLRRIAWLSAEEYGRRGFEVFRVMRSTAARAPRVLWIGSELYRSLKGYDEFVLPLGDQLAALGCEIVEVSLPHSEHAIATYYIIATAEASAMRPASGISEYAAFLVSAASAALAPLYAMMNGCPP